MRSTTERSRNHGGKKRRAQQSTHHFGKPLREHESDESVRERLIAAGKIKPKEQK